MKDYGRIYLKVYLVINIIAIFLSLLVYRVANYTYNYIRLAVGTLIISLIVSLAFWFFKREKGHSVVNIILGYLIIIPAIFVLRNVFGKYLFRVSWLIYIIIVGVSIIYGIAVYVVSKKYKKEVADLNELLSKETDHMDEQA
jgi:phosphotransferase system  glucose/maltose/N-acetylglucosamine-specific IIC component